MAQKREGYVKIPGHDVWLTDETIEVIKKVKRVAVLSPSDLRAFARDAIAALESDYYERLEKMEERGW